MNISCRLSRRAQWSQCVSTHLSWLQISIIMWSVSDCLQDQEHTLKELALTKDFCSTGRRDVGKNRKRKKTKQPLTSRILFSNCCFKLFPRFHISFSNPTFEIRDQRGGLYKTTTNVSTHPCCTHSSLISATKVACSRHSRNKIKDAAGPCKSICDTWRRVLQRVPSIVTVRERPVFLDKTYFEKAWSFNTISSSFFQQPRSINSARQT